MKNELYLEIISKSFSNLSKATEIPVKVLNPAVHNYQKEYEMQPVLDGPLPKYCKARHCTERGLKCDKCAYTAFSSSQRRKLEKLA